MKIQTPATAIDFEVRNMKTCYDDKNTRSHESLLKGYNILRQVKGMLERRDSPETILSVIYFLEENHE